MKENMTENALECYKIVLNFYMVEVCYDKLIASTTNNLDVIEKKGDYLHQIGRIFEAVKCFQEVASRTLDNGKR